MPIFFDPRTGQYYQITPGGQKTALKMQTNVDIDKNPGSSGSAFGPGSTPPTASPTPTPGTSAPPATSGAAGTGGGGTVNTQGGNISQGNIYGGTVNNAAGGGSGSLDASGGSNNIYKETNVAPASTPAPTPNVDSGSGGGQEGGACQLPAECGGAPGEMACVNGTCTRNTCPSGEFMRPDGTCFRPPSDGGDMQAFTSSPPTFNAFMKSRGVL